MSLFLCLSHISLGQYFEKKYQKWGIWKTDKKGGGHIGNCLKVVVITGHCKLRSLTNENCSENFQKQLKAKSTKWEVLSCL